MNDIKNRIAAIDRQIDTYRSEMNFNNQKVINAKILELNELAAALEEKLENQ